MEQPNEEQTRTLAKLGELGRATASEIEVSGSTLAAWARRGWVERADMRGAKPARWRLTQEAREVIETRPAREVQPPMVTTRRDSLGWYSPADNRGADGPPVPCSRAAKPGQPGSVLVKIPTGQGVSRNAGRSKYAPGCGTR